MQMESFDKVPAGNYKVAFVGFEGYSQSVTVQGGKSTQLI
jgi:hypothetical protein